MSVETVGTLLAAATRRWSQRVAIVDGARTRTYGELGRRAGRFAVALAALGVRPRDRVAVFVDDRIEAVEVFAACALGGYTLVPVNVRFRSGEAAHVIHDSAAGVLVHSATVADVVAGIDGLDELRAVVRIDDEAAPGGGRLGSLARGSLAHGYEALIAAAAPLDAPAPVGPEDLAVIGYTSGTTGFPKGACCSNRAVVTCTRLVPYVQGMVTNGTCVFTGSFSFVSALWGIVFPHLWTGATMHLAMGSTVDEWVARLAATGATYTWVPSPLVRPFGDELARRHDALARLRTVVHTGSKVPPEFLRSLVEVVGDRLVETWGLTETVGPLTATTRADLAGSDAADLLASVGRPVPTAEVAVLAGDGTLTTTPGVTGELCARGETLFSGYLGAGDDATRDVYAGEGWFRTGDVGRFDEAGYVYLEDRCKDVVVSGGMNIYPAEVELAIQTLPGVVECAVFGAPHDRWGETVVAVVVTAPGVRVSAGDVVSHVRTRLASYKKPTAVHFVEALPRNASMKVQKHVLRATFGAARETVIAPD